MRTAVETWVPDLLEGTVPRPGWLTAHQSLDEVSTVELLDLREAPDLRDSSEHPEHLWQSDQSELGDERRSAIAELRETLRRSVDRNLSIRMVLERGRDFEAEEVLRLRALHKGTQLLPELRWNGPDVFVGEQLVKIAYTQHLLSIGSEAVDRDLRFRLRIQGIGLEDALFAYVATELIDPVVLDSTLSLDVLCHADLDMTADVILQLGLARAHHYEIEHAAVLPSFCGDAMWSLVRSAWERDLAEARTTSREWAQDVVRRGRSDVAGSGVAISEDISV